MWLTGPVADGEPDPLTVFRARLLHLYQDVRSPTYGGLEAHANLDGLALARSTIGDLLKGPGRPRWETVEAFVGACRRHAERHKIEVPDDRFDLNRWHAAYREMGNTLADQADLEGAGHATVTAKSPLTVSADVVMGGDVLLTAGETADSPNFNDDLTVTCQARDGELSLREVLVHMIEEYARHNGHADLLRERIDGATGE